jgi:hypothetical protein
VKRRPRRSSIRRPDRPATLGIGVCSDPETTMQLMGLRGRLDGSTISSLAIAFSGVPDGISLHLDVTDVTIAEPGVITHLERLIDHLEQRYVRLRVVGFDPGHSALGDDRLHS